MSDPFYVEGPAVISFSGGRTSGYMLRRILDAGLQPDVHVLFADTGREFDATYRFVRAVQECWRIQIHWVERPGGFTQLITDKKFLPNPVARFCTTELKLVPIDRWMEAQGYTEWDTVVGIRADEKKRVATMRERGLLVPLADAGVRRDEVMTFWRRQPFDLELEPHESNCDLCFLKGQRIRQRIMREHPETAAWWIEQERRISGTFRSDSPSYADLQTQVRQQPMLPDLDYDESLVECYCHD